MVRTSQGSMEIIRVLLDGLSRDPSLPAVQGSWLGGNEEQRNVTTLIDILEVVNDYEEKRTVEVPRRRERPT